MEQAFGRALAELWERDGIVVPEPRALAQQVAACFAEGDDGITRASALLGQSGVREQWNHVLRRKRSGALASRIQPLVTGPMVDILAGDGSICIALSEMGLTSLSATERCEDYGAPPTLPPHIPFVPFSDDLDLRTFHASTALLSTVLHHERAPRRLLDAVARAGIPRWIVVENCVTPEFSSAFHASADRFFNTCLNQFEVHCGQEHRTLEDWTALLSVYGSVDVTEAYFMVPGIPFPYSLLVVTVPASTLVA